jgi:hypothetical protein
VTARGAPIKDVTQRPPNLSEESFLDGKKAFEGDLIGFDRTIVSTVRVAAAVLSSSE